MVSTSPFRAAGQMRLITSRSSQLVDALSLVHRHPGVCCHLLLQLPCSRSDSGHHPGDSGLLWSSHSESALCCRHLQDCILFHNNSSHARYWCVPMDATDRQVWSPSGLCLVVRSVHDLRCLGWRLNNLWQRASVAHPHGCCCWCG